MTIQEAIREAEQAIEGGRMFLSLLKDDASEKAEHERYVDYIETLLAAAKKGAAEDLKAEDDELIEESKQLNLETVARAATYFEMAIEDVQNENVCMVSDGHRLGLVIEPAMHTALAALKKVMADLVTEGEDSPNVRVVRVNVSGPKDMDKILGQVQDDLEKIFREAEERE